MDSLTEKYFFLSTDKSNNDYFTGESNCLNVKKIDKVSELPEGMYRVIDGKLFKIVSGVPPEFNKET